MMGEASEAVALHHVRGDGAAATAGCWESESTNARSSVSASASASASGIGTASSRSSSSLFSSMSSLSDGEEDEDDGATSSSRPADRRRHLSSLSLSSLSSTSSESEALQMTGPLYGMSTMRDHLPPALRRSGTGLSKYYEGRSESFTSLADVSCLADLVKKTTAYVRRPKASNRRHTATLGVKNRSSKTVAKKARAQR